MPPPSRSSPSNPVRLSDQDNGEDGDEKDGDSLLNMKKKSICEIDNIRHLRLADQDNGED